MVNIKLDHKTEFQIAHKNFECPVVVELALYTNQRCYEDDDDDEG